MRPLLAGILALALSCSLTAPAEAHIVYFKDGTVVRGQVTLKDASVTVKGADAELSFPLASVRSISFTDEPIAYEQQRLEESKVLGSDVVLWTLVAANLATVVVAVLPLLMRSNP